MLPLPPALADALRAYLPTARWFMAKHRVIHSVEAADAIPLYTEGSQRVDFLLLKVHYTQGPSQLYAFPLRYSPTLLSSAQPQWSDAFQDPACATFLVRLLGTSRSLRGRHGRLESLPLASLDCPNTPAPAQTGFEQSNSALSLAGLYFCKLYRHLERGPHPEMEMGQALARVGFAQVPRVLGSWRYRSRRESFTLGIVQQHVPALADAWSWTGTHPDPALAALLGTRTAEMHHALSRQQTPDFAPEPFTTAYRRAAAQSTRKLVANVQSLIVNAMPALDPGSRDLARQILELLPNLPAHMAALRAHGDCGQRLRIHGDLHLGQALYTGSDFILLDFEGEPARPLRERRQKHSPLRDVAGMLRSYAYAEASFPALAESLTPGTLAQSYLDAYLQALGNSSLLPRSRQALHDLLRSYLLEKALYETSYEIANRPAWFAIPAQGLLSLVQIV